MCIILDASLFGSYKDSSNRDMEPVRRWLGRGGKLVYSPAGKFLTEVPPGYRELQRSGKIKLICPETVLAQQQTLTGLFSNDSHVVALALVADVQLLAAADADLETDYKRLVKKGKVYKRRQHRQLLRRDLCI